MKEYYENNKSVITNYKKEWYDKNKEKVYEYQKQYRNKNKDKIKQSYDKRISNDPVYALSVAIRKNILKAFKNSGFEKENKTTIIIGCTFEFLKSYFENKFEPWMNWSNRGKYNGTPNYGWDVDHIIPISTAKTIEDVIKLNHYTNLQPLCGYYNRVIKSDNV